MIIVLVNWLIKKGHEKRFVEFWENQMSIAKGKGLYRETLTMVDDKEDDLKFHTFPIESPHYSTYVNIGMWRSLVDFDSEVGKFILQVNSDNGNQVITLKDFEFKMRERIVLQVVSDRGTNLPPAKLKE